MRDMTTDPPPRIPLATRLLHTMLRVGDIDHSLTFYVDALGMTLFRSAPRRSGRRPRCGTKSCPARIHVIRAAPATAASADAVLSGWGES